MDDRLRAGIPSLYVTSQLGQLSLASLQGRLIEYQLRLGVRAGMSPLLVGRTMLCHTVLPASWQVTLCDPMWHVSSGSGVATLRTAIHLLLAYFLVTITTTPAYRPLLQDNLCKPVLER